MVKDIVRTQQALLMQRFKLGGHLSTKELGHDRQPQPARFGPQFWLQLSHNPQIHKTLRVIHEILFLQTLPVARPVRFIPFACYRRTGRMNSANTGIKQGFNGGV